jgi:alkylation response protein AidB-like acyl-CoA dehydrogenase
MTWDSVVAASSDLGVLRTRFRPLFDRIAATSVARDREGSLPTTEIRELVEAGFGSLRVPVAAGGAGIDLVALSSLLIDLAEADSNVAQALRGHFAFVEDRLASPDRIGAERWFRRFVDGEVVGNAWSEVGDVALGESRTVVADAGDHWTITGEKYYSTGTVFADWTDTTARRADGTLVIALVSTRQPGVTVVDDWDGFGQRGTGSGTTLFRAARVEREDVSLFTDRFPYQSAFFQLSHVATLAGIARAVVRDATAEVRARKRVYRHGNADRVRDDVQIQQVVGELSAVAFAAESVALAAAEAVDRAAGAGEDVRDESVVAADIATAQAQIVTVELVTAAASRLFNALSASATSIGKDLDRHWRNARTVSSHNPVVYRSRIVGAWEISRTPPPTEFGVGVPRHDVG